MLSVHIRGLSAHMRTVWAVWVMILLPFRKGVEDSQRVRRRRHAVHRERADSSSSTYFTASQGLASTCGETSEGGYVIGSAQYALLIFDKFLHYTSGVLYTDLHWEQQDISQRPV